jgi:hypothetical protein
MPSCITIQNVWYMPDLNTNLLSVSGLEDKGICIISRLGFLNLIRDSRTLVTARRNKGTYVLKLGIIIIINLTPFELKAMWVSYTKV